MFTNLINKVGKVTGQVVKTAQEVTKDLPQKSGEVVGKTVKAVQYTRDTFMDGFKQGRGY